MNGTYNTPYPKKALRYGHTICQERPVPRPKVADDITDPGYGLKDHFKHLPDGYKNA